MFHMKQFLYPQLIIGKLPTTNKAKKMPKNLTECYKNWSKIFPTKQKNSVKMAISASFYNIIFGVFEQFLRQIESLIMETTMAKLFHVKHWQGFWL